MNNNNIASNIHNRSTSGGVAASMNSNNRAAVHNSSSPGVATSEATQVGFATPPVQNTLNNNKTHLT